MGAIPFDLLLVTILALFGAATLTVGLAALIVAAAYQLFRKESR